MSTSLRAILSILTVVILTASLAAGECIGCGIGANQVASPESCCTADGQCKASPAKTPARCLKKHTHDESVVQQFVPIHLLTWETNAAPPAYSETAPQAEALPVPFSEYHSPPDLHLLNSVFLI